MKSKKTSKPIEIFPNILIEPIIIDGCSKLHLYERQKEGFKFLRVCDINEDYLKEMIAKIDPVNAIIGKCLEIYPDFDATKDVILIKFKDEN